MFSKLVDCKSIAIGDGWWAAVTHGHWWRNCLTGRPLLMTPYNSNYVLYYMCDIHECYHTPMTYRPISLQYTLNSRKVKKNILKLKSSPHLPTLLQTNRLQVYPQRIKRTVSLSMWTLSLTAVNAFVGSNASRRIAFSANGWKSTR